MATWLHQRRLVRTAVFWRKEKEWTGSFFPLLSHPFSWFSFPFSLSRTLCCSSSHTQYISHSTFATSLGLFLSLSLSSVADTCILSIVQGLSASTKKQEADVAAAAAAAAQAEANSSSSRRADKPRHIRRDKEGERVFAAEQQAREELNLKTKGVRRLCPADWPYCSGGCK